MSGYGFMIIIREFQPAEIFEMRKILVNITPSRMR